MTGISDEDADRISRRGKPRAKGKLPHLPERGATHPELREWVSNAAGLPPEVRIDTVIRAGRDTEDPLTILLSNNTSLRCPHQGRLQQARTLQAFLASESDGVAQPAYLSPAEVGDFYIAICRLGTAAGRPDPVADLHERLAMFVLLAEEVVLSLADRDARYLTILQLRDRPAFDRSVAQSMHNSKPEYSPVLVRDPVNQARYVRASEWVAYLRFVLNQTVNESELVAKMTELGSEHVDMQAWNLDRSHKAHLVFYSVPEDI